MTVPTRHPYAAKAIIEHQFDVNHLDIYVTFRFPMDQGVKPADGLWLCEVNEVAKNVTASAWQDPFTMLLTIAAIPARPLQVTLEYNGPDENLRITWLKMWEPWGPIVSTELIPVTTTLTITAGPGVQDDIDISNVNIIFLDATANNITIGGFINGINGQVLHLAKIDDSANSVTLQEHGAGSTQVAHLHAEADETLINEHGGWVLACNGTDWYDTSHAKHV